MISLAIGVSLSGAAVYADSHDSEYFGRSTGNAKAEPKVPQTIFQTGVTLENGVLHKSPALRWFENFDEQIVTHLPGQADQYKLTRPFSNPPTFEEVNQWQDEARSVAKKYHELAQILKTMPIDNQLKADPESAKLDEYRTLLAQWYDGQASWFIDYIKPREPARTIEELNEQGNAMHMRSEQLKQSGSHLEEMDSSLRQYFQVHSKLTDAIQKYVNLKLPSQH